MLRCHDRCFAADIEDAMQHVPHTLHAAFALITFLAVWLFCRAVARPGTTWVVVLGWLALQGAVALTGFYTDTSSVPPRFMLLVAPPLAGMALLFITRGGRRYLDHLDPGGLTLVHVVRIPVELGLYGMFLYKTIPEGMTFSGSNFDILSGLTAPLMWWFGSKRRVLGRGWRIAWNVACIALLVNIVVRAVLSAPFPFQQLAFDQPNIAVLYFPFVWLPCCIVPLVLLAHLATLRALVIGHRSEHRVHQRSVPPVATQ
jgi:energy-coupling factor transporter transmembrane protein EcfT